ncbi:MAG: DUF1456 family protein [Spirochaetes bacterium]|nr:DUF1456 family protein [Spirochaetota bacterium]
MLNNDVLRQLRYILNVSDYNMADIFSLSDVTVTVDDVRNFLKKDEEDGYKPCNDRLMTSFLDGLIIFRRGEKEDKQPGKQIKSKKLTNNEIFKKLRIAFNLKDTDIIGILGTEEVIMSKSELSAFFRNEDHPNFKECKDQFLRKFLRGLTARFRQPD